MRKIKINPKYEHLRNFIESIPDVFEEKGREIYHLRNVIKVLTAPDGTIINIKRLGEQSQNAIFFCLMFSLHLFYSHHVQFPA